MRLVLVDRLKWLTVKAAPEFATVGNLGNGNDSQNSARLGRGPDQAPVTLSATAFRLDCQDETALDGSYRNAHIPSAIVWTSRKYICAITFQPSQRRLFDEGTTYETASCL